MKNSLENSSNNRPPIVSIPYYGNLSEVVKRLLQKYEVKIVFRINSKFDRFITLGKDPYEIREQSNVVYKISCNCGKCYVGQTKRPLRIRLDEHFKNFNLNEKFHNVINKHRKKHENNQDNHSILWNDVKILHKETDMYKRAFSEMVFIKKENDNSLNKITDIEHLNSSYNMILDFLSLQSYNQKQFFKF